MIYTHPFCCVAVIIFEPVQVHLLIVHIFNVLLEEEEKKTDLFKLVHQV